MIRVGGSIGFYRGDPTQILDDLVLLKPTFLPVVPRVLNKMYDRIRQRTIDASGPIGVLARAAFAAKLRRMKEGGDVHHPVWDKIFFRRVRAAVGGRMRYMVCGSAPIAPHILAFIRAAFSIELLGAPIKFLRK